MSDDRQAEVERLRGLLDDIEHFLCGIDDAEADALLTRLTETRQALTAKEQTRDR